MRNKIIIIGFITVLMLTAFAGVYKSNEAEVKIEKIEKNTSEKKLDSVIEIKVNERFTSYDGEFLANNLVVVNGKGKIIGKALVYTNIKELDSFYFISPHFKRTRTYENILKGLITVNDSIPNFYKKLVEDKPGIINVKEK